MYVTNGHSPICNEKPLKCCVCFLTGPFDKSTVYTANNVQLAESFQYLEAI